MATLPLELSDSVTAAKLGFVSNTSIEQRTQDVSFAPWPHRRRNPEWSQPNQGPKPLQNQGLRPKSRSPRQQQQRPQSPPAKGGLGAEIAQVTTTKTLRRKSKSSRSYGRYRLGRKTQTVIYRTVHPARLSARSVF